jgi:hypothetical protein
VRLELTIEEGKATGAISIGGIGGRFYPFKDGTLSGSTVQFRTTNGQSNPDTKWTAELVDENTVTLSRAPLELVGTNILDLIAVLGASRQVSPAVQVATVGLQVAPAATVAPASANASIRGIVQDRSRANIPGVKVMATNTDTGAESTAMTDEVGRYAFLNLTRGQYRVTASLPGFQTVTVNNLSVGDTQLVQDFTLDVGMSQAYSHQPVSSCGPAGAIWCVVLHRAK